MANNRGKVEQCIHETWVCTLREELTQDWEETTNSTPDLERAHSHVVASPIHRVLRVCNDLQVSRSPSVAVSWIRFQRVCNDLQVSRSLSVAVSRLRFQLSRRVAVSWFLQQHPQWYKDSLHFFGRKNKSMLKRRFAGVCQAIDCSLGG